VTRRRVVVTGVGAVTPLGAGREELWDGVLRGRSAIGALDRFDPRPFPSRVAAQIDDFVPSDHLDARRARRLDRFSQLAVAAARLAVEDARLPAPNGDAGRVGVFIGSALGGVAFAEEQHSGYLSGGARAVVPTLATAVFGGAGAANVAMDLGVVGPAVGNANSCASGTVAVGQAFEAIRGGVLDVALAGGAEAPLAPLTFGAFAMIGVLSRRNDDPAHASRPFDRDRDGFVMGEASAVLILEDAGRAARRGADVLAEVVGYAASNDAFHMTAPRPDGREAARAISLALTDAALEPDAIGYVNAHGSSTRLNELAETAALHAALGTHGRRVPVSGTKGLYGHPLGASGAIEAAITALALSRGVLPGTCNLETLDPACDLNVLAAPQTARPEAALSTSFGFGGMNAALVLRRVD
jgi:3-oxoacyl-[acyl-carrier-protein] synthase II